MIDVLCEFGGENLLGKARELADSAGDRVTAIVSSKASDPQRLLYLGADEVLKCAVSEANQWIEVLTSILSSDARPKLVLLPSNAMCNAVMGAVYSIASDLVSFYYDNVDLLDSNSATKPLAGTGYAVQKTFADKVNLVSIKVSSVSPPFEDSSRYGKMKDLEVKKSIGMAPVKIASGSGIESNNLTILTSPDSSKTVIELSEKIGKKYGARVQKFSGAIEVIYGPCLSIGIQSRVRDLPKFEGYLISINSKNAPISTIADAVVESQDIEKVLSSM